MRVQGDSPPGTRAGTRGKPSKSQRGMPVPSAQASRPQSREAAGHAHCLCDTGTLLMWAGDRAQSPTEAAKSSLLWSLQQ